MVNERNLRHRDFLRTFAIFKDFHPNDLLLLSNHLIEQRYEANQVVFREGDPGEGCFFIVFGSIAVVKPLPNQKVEILATLKSGQMFGQVSLIDGRPRSATCVASSRSLLLELPKARFDEMFELKESFAFRFQDYLTRVMVKQLRQANEKLSKLVKFAQQPSVDAAPEQDALEIYDQFKEAMRSADEMGIDLDEVSYDIPVGQQRDPARKQMQQERERAAQKIQQSPTPRTPSKRKTATIDLDSLDRPSFNHQFNDDGSYSVTRNSR